MKKVLFIISIILIIISFYFNQPDHTSYNRSKLELPLCKITKPTVITRISYIVDSSLRESYKKELAQKQVEFSNTILVNSCLALRRQLVSFKYIDLELSGSEYFDELHNQASMAIGNDVLKPLRENPLDFYVLVVPSDHLVFEDGTIGATDWELSDSYILLADDAAPDTLEHEFGHLMWANHSETWLFSLRQGELERSTRPENRYLIKPYARAYKCSNAGTVMSYEKIRLPIYSDPTIHYRSEPCGNKLHADNRRRVQEYINNLRK
ncbi:membrane protein [Aliivibrio wodanis]|uniref:Membrane protein n=1 Tax=Aliivibrio wodanis TaxID=80852 RepID=A0A090ITD8_9GAMM|nr:membrane protein [Aliivibrio wodanis]